MSLGVGGDFNTKGFPMGIGEIVTALAAGTFWRLFDWMFKKFKDRRK